MKSRINTVIIFKYIQENIYRDKAVLYALLYRLWLMFSGLISIIFIAFYLSPELQGFYYTFYSIVALQVFFELGLYVVIVNISSHEWAGLYLDENGKIKGKEINISRLVSLGRSIFKWYGFLVPIFIVVMGLIGVLFFPSDNMSLWLYPWIGLIVISGFNLFFMPFLSLLEGCGQIVKINKFRLTQGVISSIVLWAGLFYGLNLWSIVISAFFILIRDILLFFIFCREFFRPFWHKPTSSVILWGREVWPMQWRLALQAISVYFLLQFMTPLIFHYYGEVEAGRIGMTMQIVIAIQSLGQVWLMVKIPSFGRLVAMNKYEELNKQWSRTAVISVSAVFIFGIIALLFIEIGQTLKISFFNRILDSRLVFLFVVSHLLMQVVQVEAAYLRAFKKEPFLVVGVSGGIFAGVLVGLLGVNYGVTGVAIGYFISMFVITIWSTFIFIDKKRSWIPVS